MNSRPFTYVVLACSTVLALAGPVSAQPAAPANSASVQPATIPVPCDVPSLIDAIHQANNAGGPATLNLAPNCTYLFTAVDHESYGSDALPDITGDITILGANSTFSRTVDAPQFRFLVVIGGAARLKIDHLTMSGGNALSSGSGGGAILNLGALSVRGSTFTGNSANWGGAIENNYDSLIVNASSFSDNYVGGAGGAIDNNRATAWISDSAFLHNRSDGTAGAIDDYIAPSVTIVNSTIVGNSTRTTGGAIYNSSSSGLNVTNSTIWGNSAQSGGNINNDFSSTASLHDTIVGMSPSGGNCAGSVSDGGSNLVWGDQSCPGMYADPMLSHLGYHGGQTPTMMPLPGSPAIDAGSGTCPPIDQRGVTRPQDGDGDGTAVCDIGAVEVIGRP